MEHVLFREDQQLYHGLAIANDEKIQRRYSRPRPQKFYLPGCPQITLEGPEIGEFLREEMVTEYLDTFEPHLWLVAKQDSTHISSLIEQIVRGRNIVITEDPKLHLVWIYDRIFIKPLPKYLLSRVFWDYYLLSPNSKIPNQAQILKAALGFLRSYAYLIRHKSDFTIAQDEKCRLLPKHISYSEFSSFIQHCKFPDKHVSPRFQYGQLRLTRLNFWTKVFLRKLNYHKVEWQYSNYVARYYAPLLFLFAVFSLLLASMQVILAVDGLDEDDSSSATRGYRRFSLFAIYCVIAIVAFPILMVALAFSREFIYALGDLWRKRQEKRKQSQERQVNERGL